jgi:hypothetical protein
MLTRRLTLSGLTATSVLAGLLVGTTDAHADDGWGVVECSQAPSPHCELTAGGSPRPPSSLSPATPSESSDRHSGGTQAPTCAYQPSPYQGHPDAVTDWPPQTWYEGRCELTGAITTPVPVTSLTPAEVARLARDQLGLPRPEIGASPAGDQLVNLPTWLYLTGGWRTLWATASVPGISVTAWAEPTSVTWSMGDGTTVDCPGPGTRYTPTADPGSESSHCGHTYRRAFDTAPVTATIRWSVTWSGAGQTGTFPPLTTTNTTQFRVQESHALNHTPPTR